MLQHPQSIFSAWLRPLRQRTKKLRCKSDFWNCSSYHLANMIPGISSTPYVPLETEHDAECSGPGGPTVHRRTSVVEDVVDLVAGSTDIDKRDENDLQRVQALQSTRNLLWTFIILIIGTAVLLFSIESANNPNIPINLSDALLMFCIATSILLTACWKCHQLLMVRILFKDDLSNITRCCLSPGWALLFFTCSVSLAMLCTFGFITYPSTISFTFATSLSFGILSFFLFVGSTLGFSQYCGCCRVFTYIWQKIGFWVCLGLGMTVFIRLCQM